MESTGIARSRSEQLAAQNTIVHSAKLEDISGPLHFVGIGGIGMSALARLALERGIAVSGSDKQESEVTQNLEQMGARIFIGHQALNVKDAAGLVISTAITEDNPELSQARAQSLPVWHRSEFLAYLCKGKQLIGISGTHGKTTTTGMTAQMLLGCNIDPTVVVGGIFNRIGANSHFGKSDLFVAEIDESDRSQSNFNPHIAVITNIEADHLENYPGGLEQIKTDMVTFATNSSYGVVLCADDAGCLSIKDRIHKNAAGNQLKVVTYGKRGTDSDYGYESLNGYGVRIYRKDQLLGDMSLSVPGEHNKQNAVAAVAVGLELGIEFSQLAAALADFRGVDRRFQIIGEKKGVLVVDDYAHHPTEVVALLQAARQFITNTSSEQGLKRLVVAFQPHQPSRLRDLWSEFCAAFKAADLVLIADIYVARGKNIEGIDSKKFSQNIQHPDVHYIQGGGAALAPSIVTHLRPGDLVLTVGAGDITNSGNDILQLIESKSSFETDA